MSEDLVTRLRHRIDTLTDKCELLQTAMDKSDADIIAENNALRQQLERLRAEHERPPMARTEISRLGAHALNSRLTKEERSERARRAALAGAAKRRAAKATNAAEGDLLVSVRHAAELAAPIFAEQRWKWSRDDQTLYGRRNYIPTADDIARAIMRLYRGAVSGGHSGLSSGRITVRVLGDGKASVLVERQWIADIETPR